MMKVTYESKSLEWARLIAMNGKDGKDRNSQISADYNLTLFHSNKVSLDPFNSLLMKFEPEVELENIY